MSFESWYADNPKISSIYVVRKDEVRLAKKVPLQLSLPLKKKRIEQLAIH